VAKPAVQIRPASPMDSVNIVRLIREGYEQTPARELGDLDEQKLLEYVTTTLRHAFVVVADQGRRVLGTLGLAPIRVPWCSSVMLCETWFAVTDAYRTRGVPDQLLQAAEAFLDKNHVAAFLGTQMLTPVDMNGLIAKRRGYMPSRHTFLRLPNRQTDEAGNPVMPKKAVAT
jgi:predicted N-acetyltransferase YhbS